MPRWVVAENVPGILRIAADDVCADLERLGYSVRVWNYEAAAVGALHRMARIFFVAHSEGGRSAPRPGERGGNIETRRAGTEYQITGSGESPGAVPHTGRRLREGRAVSEAFRAERGGRETSYAERSGRAFAADADSERELQQGWRVSGFGERTGNLREDIPNTDGERFQKQQPAVTEDGEREALGSAERCRRGSAESGVGGVANGLPGRLDGYWRAEPDIPRTARGVKDRVHRLRALGNAVVPAQAYPLFRAIAETEALYGGLDDEEED
jgi:DNA (cytosine-5)-methyltransferase 1